MKMQNTDKQISSNVIKQIALIILILGLSILICVNLSMFLPSLLGAVTLYIVCRKFNFYLQEEKGWKSSLASLFLIFISLLVLVIPMYFLVDLLVDKIGNSKEYIDKLSDFLTKIQQYIYSKTEIDVLSKENIQKIQGVATQLSTSVVSSTVNAVTIISSMFFILYFMFDKARVFEKALTQAIPLKRVNINLFADKFRKLVIANAVGIPVVAIGQGLVAVVGYLIFGASNPILLFALTAVASMIPIVGAAIVYVPLCLFMIAEGDTSGGVLLLIYCLVFVGLTDNVLRFTLLKKLEDIHPLNTVFGIIMGMNLFGFMGLIFGPIMVSITLLLIQIYNDEFSEKEEEKILFLPNEEDTELLNKD